MPAIFLKAREPINSYTHFAGAGLSLVGLLIMAVLLSATNVSTQTILSSILFCLSLIGLYCASGFYHFSNASAKVISILRKLDHSMIYVLIAGTYTPILLAVLPAPKNMIFMIAIWCAALLGIMIKLCWFGAPRWLATSLYVLMGWAIVVEPAALAALNHIPLFFLVAGGIAYTIGAIIYALKKPNLSKRFGYHEIFHLFILTGSILHYIMVVTLI